MSNLLKLKSFSVHTRWYKNMVVVGKTGHLLRRQLIAGEGPRKKVSSQELKPTTCLLFWQIDIHHSSSNIYVRTLVLYRQQWDAMGDICMCPRTTIIHGRSRVYAVTEPDPCFGWIVTVRTQYTVSGGSGSVSYLLQNAELCTVSSYLWFMDYLLPLLLRITAHLSSGVVT